MSKLISIAALAIGGVIVADVLTHPKGTAAASKGVTGIEKPSLNALLGYPS